MMDRYAVVGNPVAHSLSPHIHGLFAAQTGESVGYEAILAPVDGFADVVHAFLHKGGKGLNITLPFKEPAWQLVDAHSARAERARAVNTIAVRADNSLFGDNTDGIGLVRDLTLNHQISIKGRSVLILGAGGAVRGILEALCAEQPNRVVIANRTMEKAMQLAEGFKDLGAISGCGYNGLDDQRFDLIINGTAASLTGEVPLLPDGVLTADGYCYDMMYGRTTTAFVEWGMAHGAERSVDGLGMLVEQAADSFNIWRGIRPATAEVITRLR